jgi:hypothetical protein
MEIVSKKHFFWVKGQLQRKERGLPCKLVNESLAELRAALEAVDVHRLPYDAPKKAAKPQSAPTPAATSGA